MVGVGSCGMSARRVTRPSSGLLMEEARRLLDDDQQGLWISGSPLRSRRP